MTKKEIRRTALAIIILAIAVLFWLSLPRDFLQEPHSTVLFDKDSTLLGARIADDGQWRFPPSEKVPVKFRKALLLFEDKHFYYHPGFNPVSLIRASWQNLQSRKIVSGGSTLTMQVIRLSRKGKPRNVFEKMIEMTLAVRLELQYSKSSILGLYASNAPFGGNTVGLDAAAWRYFGIPSDQLSWAEASMLAVLPNAPALIHPGRNRDLLKAKRDRLLRMLYEAGELDEMTYNLSLAESIPEEPVPLPRQAPHLLDRIQSQFPGKIVHSTIDHTLQNHISSIIVRQSKLLSLNGINNAAAIVIEVNSGNVLAYVGNVPGTGHSNDVDMIIANRSPGSLLKPILYAAMLDDGLLLPNTLLPDIPTIISGYTPKNFTMTYAGAVPARQALEKSLNIPAVRMLQEYKYERFYNLLKEMGITTLSKPSGHYGLSLILGGAEVTLWEISGLYASMARVLKHYYPYERKYAENDIHPPVILPRESIADPDFMNRPILSAGAIYLTYDALLEVNRPEQEAGWEYFTSSRKIAWKTGTSFGFRDGWAVGTTTEYVVGVWTGNADGEGRPGLTGTATAAPILFEIFSILPHTSWFEPPYDELEYTTVCRKSGHLPGMNCPETDSTQVLLKGMNTPPCPYHTLVHLDKSEKYRVNADCESVENIVTQSWFVLPPVMEWYYKSGDPAYRELPPFRSDCISTAKNDMVKFIYPENNSRIYIPNELDGTPGTVIFEVAHCNPGNALFWHIDQEYIGTTQYTHKLAVRPDHGRHVVRVIDEQGNEDGVVFWVESRK